MFEVIFEKLSVKHPKYQHIYWAKLISDDKTFVTMFELDELNIDEICLFDYIEHYLWKDSQLASAKQVDHKYKSEFNSCFGNSICIVELNDHLQASRFAGLIGNVDGASKYLKAPINLLAEVSHTVDSCVTFREEYLDVANLISQGVPQFPDLQDGNRMSEATHVVVGIKYGARAYCVLTQEVDKTDIEAVEEIEERLSKTASKMKKALKHNQNLAEFKEELFEKEKQEMARLKCRLYADLQVQPVRDCYLFDAYKICHELFQNVRKTNAASSKFVPITVYLCPLKFFVDAAKIKFRAVYDYDDEDDVDHIFYYYIALEEYEKISTKAEAVLKTTKTELRSPFRSFRVAICCYQTIIQSALRNGVLNARKKERSEKTLEWMGRVIQNHPLFKPSVLETWLDYKTAEIEMAAKMSNLNGITFLANKKQLEEELTMNNLHIKYALVLWIPPLDQRTNAILKKMTDYLETCDSELVEIIGPAEEKDDEIPWHMVQHQRKQVLGKVRELVSLVDRNKSQIIPARYFIVVGDGLDCHFSIYQDGNLVKETLDRLPNPPTGLRILESSSSEIVVKWDYEDLEYPGFHFLVQYLPVGSNYDVPWTQFMTANPGEMQTTIKTDKPLHIRVFAATFIGCSEISEMVYAEPKMEDVMESAEETAGQEAAGKRKRLS